MDETVVPSATATDFRENVALTRAILEASRDCIEILDLDARLLFMSRGAMDSLEIPDFHAVANACWLDFWKGSHCDHARAAVEAAKAGGDARFEGFCPTYRGTPRWWDVIVSPIPGPDGKPEYLLSISRDITGHRAAEQKMEALSRRLQAHMENAPVMVVEYAPDFTLIRWSPECERVFGWTAEEVVGTNLAGFRWVYDEDVPQVQAVVAEMLAGKAPKNINVNRNYRKDGSVAWCEWYNSTLYGQDGRLESVLCLGVDVTERKRAELSLLESEQRLSVALEAAELGTWEFYTGDETVAASERTCAMFDFDTLKPRLTDWIARMHPEDRSRVETALRAAPHTGLYNVEYRTIHRNGSVHWVSARGTPGRGPDGRLRVIGVAQEITERKRAEEDLRASEETFRTLADSIPQLAWMADATGWLFWYNHRWYEYTGTTPEEMQGWGWKSVHHPEHIDRVIARWKGHLETGAAWEDTFPLLGQDGRYRWFLSRAVPIRDSQGTLVRWFGTNTDITERQEAEERLRDSEERFRRLYDSRTIGIVSADSETIYDANDLFLDMIGHSRAELQAGQIRWREITPAEYIPLDEAAMSELLASGSCKPFEKEYIRKDGTRVPILMGATLLSRAPLRWLCFVLDLTERKQLERRVLQAQKLESIGLLAGGIAHDFNNLLVGIIGNASLAQDILPQNHEIGELLDRIVKTGEKAAHLTRQMLAYAGKGRIIVERVSLSELVPEIYELIQPSVSKKISVHMELAEGLPSIEADRGQLQQVVMNLVLNAAEAIGSAAGLIWIKTGVEHLDELQSVDDLADQHLRPGEYVYLEVRDTGCGMDEATRSRIFDPFFSTKFTGRGLGLAAVAGIMRGHRGGIRLTSAPNKGSTFTVLFPAAAGAAAVRQVSLRMSELRGTGTILVVDDEEVVRSAAVRSLRRYGYTVLEADSGFVAVDLFKRHPGNIELVILDLSMPAMSGEETLAALRLIRPETRVIVSSGYSEAEAMRIFHGQRVSGFIQKPYTAAQLAEKVKSAR